MAPTSCEAAAGPAPAWDVPFRLGGTVVRSVRLCGLREVGLDAWVPGPGEGDALLVMGSSVDTHTMLVTKRAAARLAIGDDGWLVIAIARLDAEAQERGGVWIGLTEAEAWP